MDKVVRLPRLTSLRFFAAAAVVAYHAVSFFTREPWAVAVTGPGFVGVSFFFVLSGFVLTWTDTGEAVTPFYRKRFARVWPLHGLMALVVVLTLEGDASRLPANLALVHDWWPDPAWNFSLNGVSWSLSCEAFFYLCFPVLGYLAHHLRSRALALTFLAGWLLVGLVVHVAVEPVLEFWVLYLSPFYRSGEFLIGMVLALQVRAGWRPPCGTTPAVVMVVLGPVFLALLGQGMDTSYDPSVFWLYDLSVLPGLVLLIAAAATADLERRPGWLAGRSAGWCGEISFALYLSHQVVFRLVGEQVSARRGLAVSVLLVVPVAAALHHAWERPLNDLVRGAATRRPAPAR